ncbi:MAG: hypothetical protein ACI9JN_000501 [Bacteroidia bacterium]|jgi:uncharacterized protein (DUF2132 family)
MKRNNTPETQQNNPLHGVKLKDILSFLVDQLGWEALGNELNINAFLNNPTTNSSLKFLRQTPWARDKVEELYLTLLDK